MTDLAKPKFPDDYLIPGIEPYHIEDAGIIYCADCRDILPHLPKVDLVLTDPPYGINYKHGQGGSSIHSKKLRKSIKVIGDNIEFDITPLLKFHRIALFGGHRFYQVLPVGGSFHIWDKRGSYKPVHTADFDTIFINWHMVGRKFQSVWRGLCRETECNQKILHPTQKPIAVMKWLIDLLKPSDIILDPFLGSGTTVVAAKELDRKFIGIEISEEYCAIAKKRLRQGVLNFD